MGRFAWRRSAPTIHSGHDRAVGAVETVETLRARGLDHAHRDRLEDALVAQFRTQGVQRRRGTFAMTMQSNAMRWAAIALALGLGVVACATPTTTDLELGQQIRFTVPSDPAAVDAGDELLKQTREIEAALEERPGVQIATVELHGGDTSTTLEFVLWGDDLDGDALARELAARFPVLGAAEIEVIPLHGEVQEPLYAKLSRQVLKIEVGSGSDEEIRARILEQLHASGFGEGTDVQVQQVDGMTTLQINAVGDGVEQEAVIEVIGGPLPEEVELSAEEGEGKRVIIERVKGQ